MPEKVHRCVKKLLKKGYEESRAWAICYSSILKKRENKKKNTL